MAASCQRYAAAWILYNRVLTLPGQQFVVRPRFHKAGSIEHNNQIGHADRAKISMGGSAGNTERNDGERNREAKILGKKYLGMG